MVVRGSAVVVATLLMVTLAHASPVVSVGTITVTPNTLTTVAINVTDAGSASAQGIEGMTFTLQLGDGLGTTPFIKTLDLLTGTIWSGKVSSGNVFTPVGGNEAQFQSRSLFTDVAGDFVNANGVLASFEIDTNGAAPGDYPILLVGTLEPGSDSQFINGVGAPVAATFTNGTLRVIPAPSSAVLIAAFGLVAARRRR